MMQNLNDEQNNILNSLAYIDIDVIGDWKGKRLDQIFYMMKESNANKLQKERFERIYNQIKKDPVLASFKVKDYANNNSPNGSKSGFCAIAFEDAKGNVGISYRGTENLAKARSQRDLIEDARIAFSETTKQIKEANSFFEKNTMKSEDNYVFGHSLGGRLAQEVFAKYHDRIKKCTVINPFPIDYYNLDNDSKKAFHSGKINVIVTGGDVVSLLGEMPYPVKYVKSRCPQKMDAHQEYNAIMKDGRYYEGTFDEVYENSGVASLIIQQIKTYINECPIKTAVVATMGVVALAVLFPIAMAIGGVIVGGYKYIEKVIDFIVDVCHIGKETLDKIEKKLKELWDIAKDYYNNNFDKGYQYARDNVVIDIRPPRMREYADRLVLINNRLDNLDKRIDRLYRQVGLLDLFTLMKADYRIGRSNVIYHSVNYLRITANKFDMVEKENEMTFV